MPTSQIKITKRERALKILKAKPIGETDIIAMSFGQTLRDLHQEGLIDYVDGVFYQKGAMVNLKFTNLEDLDGLRDEFRRIALGLPSEMTGDMAIYFRINNSSPFPVFVKNLRGLIAQERQYAS